MHSFSRIRLSLPGLLTCFLCVLLTAGSVEAGEEETLQIFSPQLAGRPPQNAGRGLIALPGGEVRHYFSERRGTDDDTRVTRYIVSRDSGRTWSEESFSAPAELQGQTLIEQNPATGEYFAIGSGMGWVARASSMDGAWTRWPIDAFTGRRMGLRQLIFIRDGKRLVLTVHDGKGCFAIFSDDGGHRWSESNRLHVPPHEPVGVHQGRRWYHDAAGPTAVELRDGRLWMMMRTAQDNHYETFSEDGGASWSSPQPSLFFGTISLSMIKRLRDGRLVMLWNNTTPLPELPRASGWPEDVFTNRDVHHAAISDDDGKTWKGFREVVLDERRNVSDYAETGGTDRGMQQQQWVELDDGLILAAIGQHPLHRRMVLFHPDYLLEKTRSNDFSSGLDDWCIFNYIEGIRGHCAYNRKPGADLIDHPNKPGKKALRIRRPSDPSLLCENQGATWNFPAGHSGTFTVRLRLEEGGRGGRISLIDRWFNPTDLTAALFAQYTFSFDGAGNTNANVHLTPGTWYEVEFKWDGLSDASGDSCRVSVNGEKAEMDLPLNRPSINGLSYVHLISSATREDTRGFLIESVKARIDSSPKGII